jgi:hypothetical protein
MFLEVFSVIRGSETLLLLLKLLCGAGCAAGCLDGEDKFRELPEETLEVLCWLNCLVLCASVLLKSPAKRAVRKNTLSMFCINLF